MLIVSHGLQHFLISENKEKVGEPETTALLCVGQKRTFNTI
jgi:hypothetical protein